MLFYDTDKDYTKHADHVRPLYDLAMQSEEDIPPPREVEFTGYKSKRCLQEFAESGIPFDGSHWMYRLEMNWDGWSVLYDLIRTWNPQAVKPCGLDPRARVSSAWIIVDKELLDSILKTVHIYGANEHLSISQIVFVEKNDEDINE